MSQKISKAKSNPELYLKPLKGRKFLPRHATFDIETNNWTKFEMAGVFDGRFYTLHESLESLVRHLTSEKLRSRIIYAHNGGKFDFLILMDELVRQNKTFSMITQGARITSLVIRSGEHKTELRDSFSLLPFSLKTLSDTFKPEHRKLSGSIDFEKEKVDKRNPLHLQYLEADCKSLYEILDIYKNLPFIRTVGPGLTRSSTALSAWRTTLKEPIKITPVHVQNFVRRSYAGGRTEIFRQFQTGGANYDVNSLYPTQMLKPLPCEYIGEASDYSDFGFHEVIVQVPECYVPILWMKTPKLIFPTGIIQGVFFSEEIKLAVRQGAKILKYLGGHTFTESDDIFKDFILQNYQMRLDNPKIKGLDNPLNIVAKDNMNHCYGKTCEKETKRSLQRVDPQDDSTWPEEFTYWRNKKSFERYGFVTVEKTKRSPHMLCHIGSAVVAYGRIHMAENIYLPYQNKLHYTDTDSGFLTEEIPTGDELGQVKKEYPVKEAFFLLPKCYYVDTGEKIIRKIKGFPKKAISQFTLSQFKNRKLSYRYQGLLSLRESLIRKNEYIAIGERIKEIKGTYDKRRCLPDGNTVPWRVDREGKLH